MAEMAVKCGCTREQLEGGDVGRKSREDGPRSLRDSWIWIKVEFISAPEQSNYVTCHMRRCWAEGKREFGQ